METVRLGTKHMHFYFYLIQACMCNLQIVTLSWKASKIDSFY